MLPEQMIEAVKNAAVENRLSCAQAHALAETLQVSLGEIGALCNELRIKISACQLGCF